MSETETESLPGIRDIGRLDESEAAIAKAVQWMRENGVGRIDFYCSGCGDQGQFDEILFFEEGGAEMKPLKTFPMDLRYDLELAVSNISNWDWVNGSGGNAKLAIDCDGRYSVTGGYYSEEIVECAPIFGSVSEAEPAQPEPVSEFTETAILFSRRELGLILRLALEEINRHPEGDDLDDLNGIVRRFKSLLEIS